MRYQSTVKVTISNVGWIGFSRTPHSNAVFSGEITLNDRVFRGDPLGYGLQGHNCGYRHRNLWNWAHCLSVRPQGSMSAFEALEYEIGLGLYFRKALLWHDGQLHTFKNFGDARRDREQLRWSFRCSDSRSGSALEAVIDGSGSSLHRVPYLRTDCSGAFEVSNNSLASATLYLRRPGKPIEEIRADRGAVLEMGGA